MAQIFQFALLGLGLGALYSLASQGLMVIYRGSGVLSFAHGAIGMVGAYVEWEMRVKHGYSFPVLSIIAGVARLGAVGCASLTYSIMRPIAPSASPLTRDRCHAWRPHPPCSPWAF